MKTAALVLSAIVLVFIQCVSMAAYGQNNATGARDSAIKLRKNQRVNMDSLKEQVARQTKKDNQSS